MSVDYIIKKLSEKDLSEDKDGFLKTLSNLTVVGEIDYKKMKNILLKIESQDGYIYIAKKDKRIIGTATLLVEQKFIHGGGKVGHIEDVSVRKEYENNGVASNLMKKLVEVAKEKGCYKVILDCESELIPFYERNNFYLYGNCMRINLQS